MSSPRAVLFDLDDTLTDRARSIERFTPEFARRFDADLDAGGRDEICRCILAGDGRGYASRERLCSHLQSSLRWRRVPGRDELLSFWRERFPRCCVERAGAYSTLQTLHRRGFALGVISNGMTFSQYTKIDVMGIRSFFSVILISEEVGIGKPDPRIFQVALDRLGLPASEALFIGDHPLLDIAAAQGVGLRAIWLNCRGEPPSPDISRAQTITSFEQVPSLCGDECYGGFHQRLSI